MSKINKRRLLKLADFLETVPRRNFDMGDWCSREATKPEGDAPGECGFAGCAVGWAAHARLFRALKSDRYGFELNGEHKADGFEVGEVIFAIDREQSMELFDPYSYPRRCDPTPKQVAKRIRQFVAEH